MHPAGLSKFEKLELAKTLPTVSSDVELFSDLVQLTRPWRFIVAFVVLMTWACCYHFLFALAVIVAWAWFYILVLHLVSLRGHAGRVIMLLNVRCPFWTCVYVEAGPIESLR